MKHLLHRFARLFAVMSIALATLGADEARLKKCSLINLIATPERFDGVRVQTVGYVRLRFEGNALFLSSADAEHENTRNGIWLELRKGMEVRDGYALVEGVFAAGNKGHMALWSGTISSIDRLEPWPTEGLPDTRPQ
jgi:hypothetical protein